MRNKILLFMVCGTGFGDQYASILTGYKALQDYKSMNYDVEVYWLVNNAYFSSDISLEVIYDLSSFGTEIKQIKHTEFDEFIKGYNQLPTRGTIMVYTKTITEELANFVHNYFDRTGLHHLNCPDYYFKKQFLNENILEISENFLTKKKEIVGVHFRVSDYDLTKDLEDLLSNTFYKDQLLKLEKFIINQENEQVMICSNNIFLKKYVIEKYSNTFYNEFTYDLKMSHNDYNCIETEKLITHSREILAEMSIFSKCKSIYTINTFLSNFVTYGIVHNEYCLDWFSKNNKLIVN